MSEQMKDLYTLVAEIEDIVTNARTSIGGGLKITPSDIIGILGEIRTNVPEEIKRAHAIIDNGQEIIDKYTKSAREILGKAKEEALAIQENTRAERESLIASDSITAAANERAAKIIAEATAEAESIRNNANILADKTKADADQYAQSIRHQACAYASAAIESVYTPISESVAQLNSASASIYDTMLKQAQILSEYATSNSNFVEQKLNLLGEAAEKFKAELNS